MGLRIEGVSLMLFWGLFLSFLYAFARPLPVVNAICRLTLGALVIPLLAVGFRGNCDCFERVGGRLHGSLRFD